MKNKTKLTLLHSNDLHGDFVSEQQGNRLVGGVSRLAGYVNQVRSEEENVVYCIAGDMFRGSVIDSEYQGVSTIEIMNMIAPDVITVGNHETDYGVAHLLFIEKCAKFPIINANLHIKTNNARLFKPCYILETGGLKILFIGILTDEVIAQTKQEALIGSFVDIHEAVDEVGRICNTYRSLDVDLTVLLTHIGFEKDKKLAEELDPTWGVDVIIGGHSHTLPEKPEVVNNVLIVQAGTGTDQIGRFDMIIDKENNCIAEYTWQCVPIDDTHCPRTAELEEVLNHYRTQTDKKYKRLVTHLKRTLTHPSRYRETELGNLFADILCESLGLDVMLLGSGSIRGTELGPVVLYSNLTECFPYSDAIYMIHATGRQLKQMIAFMLRDEALLGEHTEFYQFSEGMHVVYHREYRSFREFSLHGEAVEDDKVYRVGLQEFHYKNVDDFFSVPLSDFQSNGKIRKLTTSCRDILDEYLSDKQNLDRTVCGRLVIE